MPDTLLDTLRDWESVLDALSDGDAEGERVPESVVEPLRVADAQPLLLRETAELPETDDVLDTVGVELSDPEAERDADAHCDTERDETSEADSWYELEVEREAWLLELNAPEADKESVDDTLWEL